MKIISIIIKNTMSRWPNNNVMIMCGVCNVMTMRNEMTVMYTNNVIMKESNNGQ